MSATYYVVFCAVCISVLKQFNAVVTEPYMDEPFHVPQAQAYCEGKYTTWDPKITTPPGLYISSLILKRIFMFKCTLPMLRLTTTLSLLGLPIVLTRLVCYHQRQRTPSSFIAPSPEAVVLSAFPLAWFYGFFYYTEVPSLVFVVWTVVAASQGNHWLAGLLGLISCTFRQTNIVWVLYAYASSQLMYLRFRRASPAAQPPAKLHDPPALEARLSDLIQSIMCAPKILPGILPSFIPYASVLALFLAFVKWNGGIVLGDKSNHIPSLHVPQLYYFLASATIFAWPALISGDGGACTLLCDVHARMFGDKRRTMVTAALSIFMAATVYLFTIHHPFLLSDNRHYTFYVWRRIFLLHPFVPYLFIPGYIACGWAWFLRVGRDQTLLQTLILPVFVLPTLLPTPLLEPRYFLIPYILLRAQVVGIAPWAVAVEALWYAAINALTMGIFLFAEREGVGRFMW
ncbi:glycosyltransferase family 59 protein [Piloderma croceum F 1598]|uniref:Dol-P-Glc:Glc(2)Man(9)GlcNAc(2)-PP-Dol alpha-1,2-glucosyltransferase n=1 Tax=Piloderma croceum (strain F 1598) TaxID=765440 RepID=A0A0C3C703_PILCF|nr:glycosyltransferase family 59 protein [Piloderma croceum F 1598]